MATCLWKTAENVASESRLFILFYYIQFNSVLFQRFVRQKGHECGLHRNIPTPLCCLSHRHTHTHTDRHTQTQTQTDTDTDRHTHTHRQTQTHTHTHTHRQ